MDSLTTQVKELVASFMEKYKAKFGDIPASRKEWADFLNENKDVKDLHFASFEMDKYDAILDIIFSEWDPATGSFKRPDAGIPGRS